MKNKTRLFWLIAVFAVIFTGTMFTACSGDDDDEGPPWTPPNGDQNGNGGDVITPPVVSFSVSQSGGQSGVAPSTAIRFSFPQSVAGLNLGPEHVIIESVVGQVTRSTPAFFTGPDNFTRYFRYITVSQPGPITVRINHPEIQTQPVSVIVHHGINPSPDYTIITWKLDGSSSVIGSGAVSGGASWPAGTPSPPTFVRSGTVITLPNPIMPGFAFGGWMDGTLTIPHPQQITASGSEVYLVAGWRRIWHDVPANLSVHDPRNWGYEFSELNSLGVTVVNQGNLFTPPLTISLSGDAGSFGLSTTSLPNIPSEPQVSSPSNQAGFFITPNVGLRAREHVANVEISGAGINPIHFQIRFHVSAEVLNISPGGDPRISNVAAGQDLANDIRGAIHADIARMGGVRVQGSRHIGEGTLELNIPAGSTVQWEGHIESNTAANAHNLIRLIGPGTFDLQPPVAINPDRRAEIIAVGVRSVAIRSSSAGRVNISGTVTGMAHDGTNLGVIVLDPVAGSGRRLEVFSTATITNSNVPGQSFAINNRCSVGTIYIHTGATITGLVRD